MDSDPSCPLLRYRPGAGLAGRLSPAGPRRVFLGPCPPCRVVQRRYLHAGGLHAADGGIFHVLLLGCSCRGAGAAVLMASSSSSFIKLLSARGKALWWSSPTGLCTGSFNEERRWSSGQPQMVQRFMGWVLKVGAKSSGKAKTNAAWVCGDGLARPAFSGGAQLDAVALLGMGLIHSAEWPRRSTAIPSRA